MSDNRENSTAAVGAQQPRRGKKAVGQRDVIPAAESLTKDQIVTACCPDCGITLSDCRDVHYAGCPRLATEAMSEQRIIHFGPVWYRREVANLISFAACEAPPPNAMSTHKPWITCEACKQTEDFKREG